jgi:hypothetical protein
MTEKQFLLKAHGLLDAESARILTGEVEALYRRGYRNVAIDAEHITPVLPEGALGLKRGLAGIEDAADLAASIVNLGEKAAVQFSIFGLPVSERAVELRAPGDPAPERAYSDAAPDDTQAAADCPQCGAVVRFPGAGMYQCPACYAHFGVDADGRTGLL